MIPGLKEVFGLGKKACVSLSFFCLLSLRERILHECIIISGNWLLRNFFQQDLIFLEYDKNWFSFVHRVTIKHQDTSQCVAEWLSLQVSVLLYRHITAPLQLRVLTVLDSPIIFFSVILKHSTVYQLFIADLLYFIISYYTSSSSH